MPPIGERGGQFLASGRRQSRKHMYKVGGISVRSPDTQHELSHCFFFCIDLWFVAALDATFNISYDVGLTFGANMTVFQMGERKGG